jgi:methyl-accepting chemotaxis protein
MAERSAKGRRSLAPDFQVFIAIGGLVVLVVGAVAIGLALVITLDAGTDRAERQARYVAAIDMAALYAKAIANDERGYLMSGNREFLEEIEERTASARAAFAEAVGAAAANQRGVIASARDGFEEWLDAVHAGLAAYEVGRTETAVETSLGQTRALRKAYEEQLAFARRVAATDYSAAIQAVTAVESGSFVVLLTYLVGALTAGTWVGVWVVRRIMRPAYSLLRVFTPPSDSPDPT